MTTEIGYQEYSIKQKCLHFNPLTESGPTNRKSNEWETIGLCTIEDTIAISEYCDRVILNEGKFDIRDVKIAYELVTKK